MFDPNFDRQKLMFHPLELAEWFAGGKTRGPLYTELELSNRCNCRCIFCGVDHQVNQTTDTMDLALAQKIVAGLAAQGNKSVMLCGHGEPLLNRHVVEIVEFVATQMSVSMTTNGLALSGEKMPLLDHLEWIRFSVNGCDPENYSRIQGASPDDFPKVMANIASAVARKRELSLSVTIGTQLVLLPENSAKVVGLARQWREIGVDYFSIKPYSQHPLSQNRQEIDYHEFLSLEEELKELETDSFKIIFRASSMRRAGSAKSYRQCFGTHFIAFVSANGDIWECNVYAGDQRFFLGNAGEESISEIWKGSRRQKVVSFIENELSLSECRDLCRMDSCNTYLWRLKNPRPHDNFI
jgi:radical SAM protein with 4Fe4S-binding SPASM domain